MADNGGRNQARHYPQQADTDRAGVPRLIEKIISNPEPRGANEHDKRDLAAQEATAAWAFWIVFFAFFQTAVGAFGLFAILKTLRHTERSLTLADQTLLENRHGLRAWVNYGGPAFLPVKGPDAKVYACIQAKWQNFGQTPAINMEVFGALQNDLPDEEIERLKREASKPLVLGPTASTLTNPVYIDLMEAFTTRRFYPYRSKAEYQDIWGSFHQSEVIFEVQYTHTLPPNEVEAEEIANSILWRIVLHTGS